MRKHKPSKRVLVIVDKFKTGVVLCKAKRINKLGSTEVEYFFESGGRSVGPGTALKAINRGLLAPSNDGLFGYSQTWTAK